MPRQTSVLQEIIEQLAAITPEKHVAPEAIAGGDVRIVGTIPEHLRALYTLMESYRQAHVKIMREGQVFLCDFAKVPHDTPPQILIHLHPELPAEVQRHLEDLNSGASTQRSMYELLHTMFWLDMKREFPSEMTGTRFFNVFNDWSLGWTELKQRPDPGIAFQLELDPDKLPPELAAALGMRPPGTRH